MGEVGNSVQNSERRVGSGTEPSVFVGEGLSYCDLRVGCGTICVGTVWADGAGDGLLVGAGAVGALVSPCVEGAGVAHSYR